MSLNGSFWFSVKLGILFCIVFHHCAMLGVCSHCLDLDEQIAVYAQCMLPPWNGTCKGEAAECFAARLLIASIGKFSETSPEKYWRLTRVFLWVRVAPETTWYPFATALYGVGLLRSRGVSFQVLWLKQSSSQTKCLRFSQNYLMELHCLAQEKHVCSVELLCLV